MTDVVRVIEWFVGGDTGISSESIAAFMCGADMRNANYVRPPSDPGDLGRCLRLLELFPEWKVRLHEMASIDERWAKVVPHWDTAAVIMADEVGIDWSKGKRAPLTYEFMKKAGF